MEEVAGYECICRNSNGFKDKNKKANCWKWGRNLFYRWRSRRFEDGFEADDERSKFASSKVSSSTCAMLCAAIPPQHNARVILTLPLTGMYAAVGSRIVCDCLRLYGKNSLYDRLRPAIRDRLRSFAIIWKPALIIFYFLNYYF